MEKIDVYFYYFGKYLSKTSLYWKIFIVSPLKVNGFNISYLYNQV